MIQEGGRIDLSSILPPFVCAGLEYQVAFQRKDLQSGELVSQADDIQGVGHIVHDVKRCGVHNGNAGVVTLHIVAVYDNGIVAGAGQGFRDKSAVGTLADGAVGGDVKLAYPLENPPLAGQEDVYRAAVWRQVYRAETPNFCNCRGSRLW